MFINQTFGRYRIVDLFSNFLFLLYGNNILCIYITIRKEVWKKKYSLNTFFIFFSCWGHLSLRLLISIYLHRLGSLLDVWNTETRTNSSLLYKLFICLPISKKYLTWKGLINKIFTLGQHRRYTTKTMRNFVEFSIKYTNTYKTLTETRRYCASYGKAKDDDRSTRKVLLNPSRKLTCL